ncbi:hypothetical protein CHS0354_032138, partial [Potamilus streckersoni]
MPVYAAARKINLRYYDSKEASITIHTINSHDVIQKGFPRRETNYPAVLRPTQEIAPFRTLSKQYQMDDNMSQR